MALQITEANYEQVVDTDKLVIIDFWAEWCGPCKRIAPVIEDLAKEFEGKIVIGKCDVEENTEITSNPENQMFSFAKQEISPQQTR